MDRISLLSDDLILKILSLVPSKVAVATSLLSNRWCSLWKHVPKLVYRDPSSDSAYWRASRFVDKFLLHNEALVLETLLLSLSHNCPPTDIATCIRIAVSRGVRDLRILQHTLITFPRRLYACQTLVTLRLCKINIADVPRTFCFRSLKVLYCVYVFFSRDDVVHRLLSGCPVLEELTLGVCRYGNERNFLIVVPSLPSLVVVDLKSVQGPGADARLVIKSPSLQSLTINEFNWVASLVVMPNLVSASIKLRDGSSHKLIRRLTSARHLSLCVKSPIMVKDSYPDLVFKQLVSLTLCTCSSNWSRFILRHTPELRRFRVVRCYWSYGDDQTKWERPSSVPQCLISSLETVEWIDYRGTETEKEAVIYLLENSGRLKEMAIRPLNSAILEERHKMLQEISSTQRSSRKCRLSFT